MRPWWANWRKHLTEAAVPLFMVMNLFAMILLWPLLGLPELPAMVVALKGWFDIYGLPIILLTGFIEALFMVGIYLPGSLAIFMGIFVYVHDPLALWLLTLYCWLSFMAAMVVNYALGYYGFYRIFNFLGAGLAITQMRKNLTRYGTYIFLPAAVHPNYMSVVVTCAGLSRMPILKCLGYAGLSMAVMGPIMVFAFAQIIESITSQSGSDGLYYVFIGTFVVWAAVSLGHSFYQDYKKTKE